MYNAVPDYRGLPSDNYHRQGWLYCSGASVDSRPNRLIEPDAATRRPYNYHRRNGDAGSLTPKGQFLT